ncbi:MAG: Histidine kinase family [Myxococcaceae bacterium]|jgi:two-component system sensor histidine kinase AlgZ|nr:Histidine kinase family [Myxococcaceae bacterium]
MTSTLRPTLRALLDPRRLAPILLVSLPLVFAQRSYSRDPRAAWLGVLMVVGFVLVAPVSWRVLFPDGLGVRDALLRLVLYGAIGAGVVLSVGVVVPRALAIGPTFLTARNSLAIDIALFLVGGWGLGRDIGFEASLTREKRRTAMLAREAEQAQLLALRSHLDPHFLFNTLNAIAEWCRTDGETAERAVLQLSAMLRAVLSGVKESSWPLDKELELARTLLALHLLRDPAMFELVWNVAPEATHAPVPPMLLLPLVENAVKHGPAQGHKGPIAIGVRTLHEGAAAFIEVTVESPGRYGGPRAGSHGLPTVERRLAIAYDGKASLRVESIDTPPRTRMIVRIPAAGPEVTT